MSELVALGVQRLPGEVVAIRGNDGDRPGLRVHRRPGRRRPGGRTRPARCRPGSARACSAASSTGCSGRWPGPRPGSSRPETAATRRRTWTWQPRVDRGRDGERRSRARHRAGRRTAWSTACWCRPAASGRVEWLAARRHPRPTGRGCRGRRASPSPWPRTGRCAAPRPVRERLDERRAPPHRPAGARPAVPVARGSTAAVPGRLRHRQDRAAAADREVVRRRRHRLRRLRRARQRDGRRRSPSWPSSPTRAPAAGWPTAPSSSPTPRTCR